MEVRIRPNHKNLLSNSLTARVRKTEEVKTKSSLRNHCGRQSGINATHISGLNFEVIPRDDNRQHDGVINQISPRSIQIQRGSYDKQRSVLFEPGLRTRSELSSASLLPRLVGNESSMSQATMKEQFPQFAFIDKDDLSHVKVFKLKGVFQPQNKYFNKIEPIEISEKVKFVSKDVREKEGLSPRYPEDRNGSISPYEPPKSRMSRMSRKGLRVTWSRRSQYYSADEEDNLSVISPPRAEAQTPKLVDSRAESREENVRTPSTTKSFSMKSESFFVKKRPGKRKVDTVGLKWAIPPSHMSKSEPSIRKPVRTKFGNLSHNLMPVTAALDENGRSTNKMRWKVQSSDSLRKSQTYQNWVDQLADLKAGKLETLADRIPNRANLSVMTQPVK